jgi:hypothetical protein
MSLSKKDFIDLADRLRGRFLPDEIRDVLIDFCKSQNSQFDKNRWLGYLNGECGPNGGKPNEKAK